MRRATSAFLFLLLLHAHAQMRINEVHCTRAPGSDGKGNAGDWIEVYNAGNSPTDLLGYTFAITGMIQRIETSVLVPAKGYRVLWCDNTSDEGPDHLALSLPRLGATLLLIAPDRVTVLDLFAWPALPAGVSMGRERDGERAWGYFAVPTPGYSNLRSLAATRCLAMPTIRIDGDRALITATNDATIHFTLDGTLPQSDSPLYTTPILAGTGAVLRARCFAKDAIPSPCAQYSLGIPDDAWALTISPEDLWGEHGIADRTSGNYARKGPKWQRSAGLQHGSDPDILPVGIAISGSGSRSLAKKNFRLFARDRFGSDGPIQLPDGSAWREVMLRGDATANAFLRNSFIAEVVHRSGDRVDVQASTSMPLYINGRFQGLYRMMPAKNTAWAERLNAEEPVDLIEGPGVRVVSGSSAPYKRMLNAIADHAPFDTLDRLVDMGSLIDLACFDLWTGRADHDLNVRSWRPRTKNGRWRWVLFDMDLWSTPKDLTVQRMCSSSQLETPFLPQLLGMPETRDLLLARLSTLLATTLSADRAGALADSLIGTHRTAMRDDLACWKDSLEMPSPDASHEQLLTHIRQRSAPLLKQLATKTGKRIVELELVVDPPTSGSLILEGLPLTDDRKSVSVFSDVPIGLVAIPSVGMEFAGWRGADGEGAALFVAASKGRRIVATFRPIAVSRQGGL